MDIGAAGHLILFFSIMVGLILVGLLVFSYAAYSFLATLIDTAAGTDEIIWPGEPIQDWLFKIWYLGWVLAVWAVPVSLVVTALGLPRAVSAAWLVGLLWLVFPVGLLSSLSAQTWLIVFRPTIVRLLLKHPGATLYFYVSSALIVAICGGLAYAAVFGLRPASLDQPAILIPLAAAVGAAGWLLYARLLGRVAHIISQPSHKGSRERGQERSEEEQVQTFDPWAVPVDESRAGRVSQAGRRPGSKPPRTNLGGQTVPTDLPKKKRRDRKPERSYDPWAIPAQEPIVRKTKPAPSPSPEDPYGPAEGAYELAAEETQPLAESPARYSSGPEEKVEGYAVSTPSDQSGSKLPSVVPEVSKLEEELAAPRRPPPVPDRPLVSGVYNFIFYPQTIGPCATLALGFVGVLGLMRILLALFPV